MSFRFVASVLLSLLFTSTYACSDAQVGASAPQHADGRRVMPVSGALSAASFAGTGNHDIHDRANAAMATCQVSNAEHPHGCNVHIPAPPVPYACWPVSTTLNVPISVHGSVAIYWDDGACEDFFGSGPAVNIGGGALPQVGVHLMNPKINGVQDPGHLSAPNTVSPGAIIVGHWEGVVIDNPNITNFQASPAQLSHGKTVAKLGACGICAVGTDAMYVSSGNLEGNWDNLTLGVGDGYGTNNGVYDFHGSGARHRNINAESIGAGNVIHVAADPSAPDAEEVIGYFGQGFGNFLDVRYSEGALGDQGGYTPPNGVRGKYGLVVAGGELHIGNYQSGLTQMTSSILVDNGGIVYVDFASDGDDRSGAFFDFGPNLGPGRPGYFHIASFYGYTGLGPGHNPKGLPCSAIVYESPYWNPRNAGGPITTTCAVLQVEPYFHGWVTNGFTAADGSGIKFRKPAVGTLPAHNAVTTWGSGAGNEFGGAYDDVFEYLKIRRTAADPAGTDRSGEVPTTRWVGSNFVDAAARGKENGVAPLDANGKVPAANLPSTSQLLSFGVATVANDAGNTGGVRCFGLNGSPGASVSAPAAGWETAYTPIPAGHTFTVSDLSFALDGDPGAGSVVTVSLRDNGAPTPLACTVTGTGSRSTKNACEKTGSYTLSSGHRGSWCVDAEAHSRNGSTYQGAAVGSLQ